MTIEAHALLLISALVSNWSIGIDGTRRLMGIRKRILTQHLLEDGQHASIQSIDRELGYCAGQSLKWDQFGEISGGKVPEEGISQSDLLMVRSVLVSDGVPANTGVEPKGNLHHHQRHIENRLVALLAQQIQLSHHPELRSDDQMCRVCRRSRRLRLTRPRPQDGLEGDILASAAITTVRNFVTTLFETTVVIVNENLNAPQSSLRWPNAIAFAWRCSKDAPSG